MVREYTGVGTAVSVENTEFILVLFISYCIIYLYYNYKPTFVYPYILYNFNPFTLTETSLGQQMAYIVNCPCTPEKKFFSAVIVYCIL